jgi:hypothetical protein
MPRKPSKTPHQIEHQPKINDLYQRVIAIAKLLQEAQSSDPRPQVDEKTQSQRPGVS